MPPRTTAAGQPVRLWTSLYVSPNHDAELSPWRIAGCGITGQTIRSTSWIQRSRRARISSICSTSAESSSPGSGGSSVTQSRVAYEPTPGVPAAVISRWSQA